MDHSSSHSRLQSVPFSGHSRHRRSGIWLPLFADLLDLLSGSRGNTRSVARLLARRLPDRSLQSLGRTRGGPCATSEDWLYNDEFQVTREIPVAKSLSTAIRPAPLGISAAFSAGSATVTLTLI